MQDESVLLLVGGACLLEKGWGRSKASTAWFTAREYAVGEWWPDGFSSPFQVATSRIQIFSSKPLS